MENLIEILKQQINTNIPDNWSANDIIHWYEKLKILDERSQLLNLKGIHYKLDIVLILIFDLRQLNIALEMDSKVIKFILELYNCKDFKLEDISRYNRTKEYFQFSLERLLSFQLSIDFTEIYILLLNNVNTYYGLYLLLYNFDFKNKIEYFFQHITNTKAYIVACYFCLYQKPAKVDQQFVIELFRKILLGSDQKLAIDYVKWWAKFPVRVESSIIEFGQILAEVKDIKILYTCAMTFHYSAHYSSDCHLMLKFLNAIEDHNTQNRILITTLLHERREMEFVCFHSMKNQILKDKPLFQISHTDFCPAEIYYLLDDISHLTAKLTTLKKHLEYINIYWFKSFIEWKSYFLYAILEFCICVKAYEENLQQKNPINLTEIENSLFYINEIIQKNKNKLGQAYNKDTLTLIDEINTTIMG